MENKTNKSFNLSDYRKLHYIFRDVNNVLDGYRYYTKNEIKENERIFIIAVIYNDINYIHELVNMLDKKNNKELINKLSNLPQPV